MNILLLGGGGREHALAWALAKSPVCKALYIAPGNAGTTNNGTNVDIDPTDFEALAKFCPENEIDMVVVGPETPLVAGVVDFFATHKKLQHIPVIGPSKACAQLEGSKAFSKAFMQQHNIPTAAYKEFTAENINDGLAYIDAMNVPIVLKADGLAAGKGVLICESKEEAKASLKEMIVDAKFGDASKTVVIEEFLKGIEFSVFALSDGESYKLLPPAKDYKRIGEGDTGLNTGGMGAVTPLPFVDDALMKKVEERVVKPTLEGLKKAGTPYVGFLYCGLMKVGDDPVVIEYNVRLGDPEAEVLIPLFDSDLVKVFRTIGNKKLGKTDLRFHNKACATIILASGGYPEAYENGKEITGSYEIDDSLIFHAGTRMQNNNIYTNGGRVMAITTIADDLKTAVATSVDNAKRIDFDGKYFRSDIGFDVL